LLFVCLSGEYIA